MVAVRLKPDTTGIHGPPEGAHYRYLIARFRGSVWL
jgi:hypothetical protein